MYPTESNITGAWSGLAISGLLCRVAWASHSSAAFGVYLMATRSTKRHVSLAAAVAVLFIGTSCVSRSKIEMESSNPPTFSIHGSAVFDWCEVSAASQGRTPVWRIRPGGIPPSLSRVSSIAYGSIPVGFVQEIPANREAPPLVEGEVYNLGIVIRTPDSIQISKSFTIRNGKAEELKSDGDDQYLCKDLFYLYCL